jgi:hypothetical protein
MEFLQYRNRFRKYFAEKLSAYVSFFYIKGLYRHVLIKLFTLCAMGSGIQAQGKTVLCSIRQRIHCAYEWEVLVPSRAVSGGLSQKGCKQPSS